MQSTVGNSEYLSPKVTPLQKERSRNRETIPYACHFIKPHPACARPGNSLGQHIKIYVSTIWFKYLVHVSGACIWCMNLVHVSG